jgi:hypoxanthine phosphoribosyltransferase
MAETGTSRSEVAFAHPSEAEFARILDFYQIAWEYEPKTFVLRQDDAGNIIEAFSPDFYLPEQDLYIELTTMEQRLITKKHRKLRRLRELYPDINIKLLNRSDFKRMMMKYELDNDDDLIGQRATS